MRIKFERLEVEIDDGMIERLSVDPSRGALLAALVQVVGPILEDGLNKIIGSISRPDTEAGDAPDEHPPEGAANI